MQEQSGRQDRQRRCTAATGQNHGGFGSLIAAGPLSDAHALRAVLCGTPAQDASAVGHGIERVAGPAVQALASAPERRLWILLREKYSVSTKKKTKLETATVRPSATTNSSHMPAKVLGDRVIAQDGDDKAMEQIQ